MYIDDLKVSHVDPAVVDEVLSDLGKVYKKLNVCRGKVHTYLGMTLDYTEPGVVKITMKNMVQEAIDALL